MPRQRASVQARQFASLVELECILLDRTPDAILMVAGANGFRCVSMLLALRRKGVIVRCPLIVEVPRESLAFEQLVELRAADLDLRLVLRGDRSSHDGVEIELKKIRGNHLPSAAQHLFAELGGQVPRPMAPVLIPVMAVGSMNVAAPVLEAVSPMTGRAMRQLLRSRGLPSPRRALAQVAGFGVAYNTQLLRMSLGAAARHAGFQTEDALRRCLKARTGLSPSDWKHMGIASALERLACAFGIQNSPALRRI